MKDDAEGDEITSRLETIEVGADVDGDPMTSCVVVPAEAGIAKDATIKPTGQAGIALEALYEALAECGEMVPSSHIPPQTRTTTIVFRGQNDRRPDKAGQQAKIFCPGFRQASSP